MTRLSPRELPIRLFIQLSSEAVKLKRVYRDKRTDRACQTQTPDGSALFVAAMAAFGASSPFPPIPANVASSNRQRPLRLGGGNWSSCPIPAVDRRHPERRSRGGKLASASDFCTCEVVVFRRRHRTFAANAARLQLHALAYNLGNFMRTLAMPKTAEPWSLTSLREKLIKIGAKIVNHGRYVTFQMAEVAVPRQMFQEILSLIARLRPPPAPA